MDDQIIRPIKKLSQEDVDRIAAGEVIQRPRNAVKELIENSLDAGATSIDVTVKYFPPSDFKSIKIKDNGHGFRKEDLSLACERFATSKLAKYDDLSSIKTFGFRGEALASISRVARVSITSKSGNSLMGFKMDFENGCPKTKEPQPVAANPGSIILVADLFRDDKKRKSTLPNASEEYGKIAELVSLYSLDNTHVSFRLSKEGSSDDDVRTDAGEELLARVKKVVGSKAANNLVPLQLTSDEFRFEATGLFGDLNSNLKSYKVIIFINKRLVDCAPLKKAVEAIYKSRLSKGSCPLVFLSLNIKAMLDVNIHPTKQEVRFDYEEQVINSIANHIESVLTSKTTSTVGLAQALKTKLKMDTSMSSSANSTINRSIVSSSPSQRPDFLNRSNPSIQTIDSMMRRRKSDVVVWREVKLTSVTDLRDEVEEEMDETLKDILKESTFVGLNNDKNSSILIQSDTALLSIPLDTLTSEMFYQKYLCDFGNFGVIELEQKPSLKSLLEFHRKHVQDFDVIAATEIIMERREMMDDYFSVVLTNDLLLESVPIIVSGYLPNFKKIPKFLYNLAFTVDWTEEKRCFKSFGKCLADFYSLNAIDEEFETSVKDNLFPLIKRNLKPSKVLKGQVSIVTSVPTLYKVFHRC